jgi:hypothetical protein
MHAQKVKTFTPVERHRIRDERLRVRRWRREQFRELGFAFAEANSLATSTADLNEARKLVQAGCPRDTVFRIIR